MEKPSRERLTKLFNIDYKQRSFSLFLTENNLQSVFSNPNPFTPQFFPRIAPSDLILKVHFVLKDFTIDKSSNSIDTSIELARKNEQLVLLATT